MVLFLQLLGKHLYVWCSVESIAFGCTMSLNYLEKKTDNVTFLSDHEALFNRANFWEYFRQSFIRSRSWQAVNE